ncbi:hypothetical protein WMY93_009917 [Mugilogobius chulae]|uniref:Uncharacterized protein n=1 Tax=Mugilogobius chulae TaxID=88201 RepID=A0AAW0PI79_9GOBI
MATARDRRVSSTTMKSLASELNELKSKFLRDLKRRLLLDFSLSGSENVERRVSAAVKVFDQQRQDVLFKTLQNNT